MRKAAPFWLTITVAVVALVASALLFVDYVRPAVFCDPDGGCGSVKRSVFAYPLGIPMPAIGLSGLLLIVLLALVPGRRARLAQAAVAVLGAIVAAGLIVLQVTMKTICPYCMVVDTSAIVLAGLSIARVLRGWDPPTRRLHVVGAAVVAVLAIAATLTAGFLKSPLPSRADAALPEVIATEIKKTPAGKITVVDFTDFECPWCRKNHAVLAPLLAEYKDRVRVVRKNVPLGMHPHAMDAARAASCAEILGKGDEVADALFTAEDLTPEGCEKIATEHGLDLATFRACVKSDETLARLRSDAETWRAAKGKGLPTVFIGAQRLEGAQEEGALRAAFDSALGTR